MWLSWQQENETSSGTGGQSTSYRAPLTDLATTAKTMIATVGKTYNLRAFNNVDDWTKLL